MENLEDNTNMTTPTTCQKNINKSNLCIPQITTSSTNPPPAINLIQSPHKPKLENVTEWLNKSFDHAKTDSNGLLSTNHLLVQKQQRSNSVQHVRVITDEPLVEINLNRHFYLQKSRRSTEQLEQQSTNLNSPAYSNYSKSQNTKYAFNPNSEMIQKILLYKDPKEVCQKNDLEEPKTPSRRPSIGLGLQIAACQRLPDLNDNQLAAVVQSIEPDGIIEKFNVEIKKGDEIMEINGINLRNKSEDQIEKIIDTSCQSFNGEIELIVRRSSTCSNKSDTLNRASTPRQKYEMCPDELQSTGSSDLPDNMTTPASEINEQYSITSSPVSSENLIAQKSGKKLQNQNSNSSSGSSNGHRQLMKQKNLNYINENEDLAFIQNKFIQKKPFYEGEGRGFRELSIKRKETSAKDVVMTDPASMFRKRMSNVQEIAPRIQNTRVNNEESQFLQPTSARELTRASSQPPSPSPKTFNKKFAHSIEKDLPPVSTKQNSENLTSPTQTQVNLLARFRSSSPYRNNSITDVKIKINNTESEQQMSKVNSRKSSSNDTGFDSLNGKTINSSQQDSEAQLSRQLSGLDGSSSHSSRRNSKEDSDSVYSYNSSVKESSNNKKYSLTTNLLNLPETNMSSSVETISNSSSKKSKSSFKLNKKSSDYDRSLSPTLSKSGKDSPFGDLQIQLSHNEEEQQIIVKVLRARNLIAKDANGFSDPFVKVYLLPGRE